MSIFGPTIHTLEQSLDYSTKKNQVISNNIANVDTPNFKAGNVTFKNVLGNEVERLEGSRTDPKHLNFSNSNQSYSVHSQQGTTFNHNGNNVDIEKEMSNLAENQIYYQSMVDRLNGKFGLLQTVIKGGR